MTSENIELTKEEHIRERQRRTTFSQSYTNKAKEPLACRLGAQVHSSKACFYFSTLGPTNLLMFPEPPQILSARQLVVGGFHV